MFITLPASNLSVAFRYHNLCVGNCTSDCVVTYIVITLIFPCVVACFCTEILEEIGAVQKLVTEKVRRARLCLYEHKWC